MPIPPVDYMGSPVLVGRSCRLRQGVYAGYWGTVKRVEGNRVWVEVPSIDLDGPPATVDLNSRSIEQMGIVR